MSKKQTSSFRNSSEMFALYRSIVFLASILYFFYAVVLFFFGLHNNGLIFLIAATLNIVMLLFKDTPYRIMVLTEHFSIMITVFLSVSLVGLRCGFQNLLFLNSALSYFTPFQTKHLNNVVSIVAIIVYWILNMLYFNVTPPIVVPDDVAMILNSMLFTTTTFVIMYGIARADVIRLIEERRTSQLTDKLSSQAMMDELTGVFNRRAMKNELDNCWNNYRLNNEVFYVALGDIDDFKKINDCYGHHVGDEALKKVSVCLKNVLKDEIISRWGGDEFLIVFQGGTMESAYNKMELFRKELELLRVSVEEETIGISMTFGISSCEGKHGVLSVIQSADEKLYVGKKNHKNNIVK